MCVCVCVCVCVSDRERERERESERNTVRSRYIRRPTVCVYMFVLAALSSVPPSLSVFVSVCERDSI